MDNDQARAYAVIAMKELISEGVIKDTGDTIEKLYFKMYAMFDRYTEEEAEELRDKILRNR